jgi:threonine synthase
MTETPLIKTDIFKEKYGLLETYIKDESKNEFGTVKDRRNKEILQDALRLGVDKLVLITSGNNGYSFARLAHGTNVKVVSIVNKNIDAKVKNFLKEVCYQVIEVNLEHKILRTEEIIAFAREKEDEVIWDVTNGYEEHYVSMLAEIVKKVVPDYIVVPVGSGGIFVGMAEGVNALGLKTKVIGVGVQNTASSFADKLFTPWTPYHNAIVNYKKMGHELYRVNEEEVKDAYKKYKHLVDCEPSSAIVFCILNKYAFSKNDKIVFINSGKAIF